MICLPAVRMRPHAFVAAGVPRSAKEPTMVNRRRLSFIAWGASIVAIAIWAALGCSRKVEQKSGGPSAPEITGSAGRLHVDDGGKNGLPLLFVHSYAGSSANWSAQLAYFRPTRRAVAFDLRGHGKAQAPASGDYVVKSLARDIASVADGLHLDRFVLIGTTITGTSTLAHPDALPTWPALPISFSESVVTEPAA